MMNDLKFVHEENLENKNRHGKINSYVVNKIKNVTQFMMNAKPDTSMSTPELIALDIDIMDNLDQKTFDKIKLVPTHTFLEDPNDEESNVTVASYNITVEEDENLTDSEFKEILTSSIKALLESHNGNRIYVYDLSQLVGKSEEGNILVMSRIYMN